MAPIGVCQFSIKCHKDDRTERHPGCGRIESGEKAGAQTGGLICREVFPLLGHFKHVSARNHLKRHFRNKRREQRADVDAHVEDAVGRILERAVRRIEVADHRRDIRLEEAIARRRVSARAI